MAERKRKMECTRQRLVYRNICSPNEITWQFYKRHIDLCLQTITTQTIDEFSMCLSENVNRAKKKNMHTKLINIAVDAVMAFIAVCTHFLYLKFVFVSVCCLHSKHIYPGWHRANTASPHWVSSFFLVFMCCKLYVNLFYLSTECHTNHEFKK